MQKMSEIAQSAVSDKDIMDWLRDYATPRIRAMRVFNALHELAEPVIKEDNIPGFVMPFQEFQDFRKMLQAIVKTESMALAFEPCFDAIKLGTGKVGLLFGFMPVMVKKDEKEISCFASDANATGE